MESLESVRTRARATRETQYLLKDTWVWKKATLEDWDRGLAELEAKSEETTRAATRLTAVRGELDAKRQILTQQTIQARGVARAEFSSEPEKLALVQRSKNLGNSREDDLQEGLEWLSIWEQVDPAWSPAPGVTLESFRALYGECRQLFEALDAAHKAWISVSEQLKTLAAQLHEQSVDWYAVATKVFDEGTYEGDLIRRAVPTTYQPGDDAPPPPA